MADVVRAWPAAVGDAVARNAWPARIGRDGTLHVATSSSAWAFELSQLEPRIRSQLAGVLGKDAQPRRLRFAPGRLPEPDPLPGDAAFAPVPEPRPADVAEGERLAADIEDENLRKLVAKAAAASLARAASGRSVW